MNNWLKAAALCAGALLFLCGLFMGRGLEKRDAARALAAETGALPAGETAPFSGAVPLIPGTEPEMLSPAYWTRGEDRLLFSAEEIAAFNENNPPFVSFRSPWDGLEHFLYFYDLPETISGEDLHTLMEQALPADFFETRAVYMNGSPLTPAYREALEAARDLEGIPETVQPRYALCVRRTQAMLLPAADFAAPTAEERYCNELVSAELLPFTGAVLLHESRDGAWGYALCGSFCGWLPMEDLALCPDRESWLEALRPQAFLVVTGSEIVLEQTAEPGCHGGEVLPMGTWLALVEDRPAQIDGREGLGSWAVRLPCRAADGSLAWEQALIPVSRDVHEGWLPMSSHAVIRQGFKFLGRIYGWGGSLDSNDCSGMIRQIYGCFGLELPRNALAIAKLQDLGCLACRHMSRDKKLELLARIPAGNLLYMDGHLMLYLGMDGGKPYVLSACATYREPAGGAPEIRESYCVFVSGLDLLRSSGKTWLEDLSFLQWRDF